MTQLPNLRNPRLIRERLPTPIDSSPFLQYPVRIVPKSILLHLCIPQREVPIQQCVVPVQQCPLTTVSSRVVKTNSCDEFMTQLPNWRNPRLIRERLPTPISSCSFLLGSLLLDCLLLLPSTRIRSFHCHIRVQAPRHLPYPNLCEATTNPSLNPNP